MELSDENLMGFSSITTALITIFTGLIVNFLIRLYKHRKMMSGLVSFMSICLHSCQLTIASPNHRTILSLAT